MHRYVTSVGVWLSKKSGGSWGGRGRSYTYISSPGSLYLNWPQLPGDRPCVQGRQRDDVYNIALFLISSSHSLQPPWDLSVGEESLIFEAAIGYCCFNLHCGRTEEAFEGQSTSPVQ